MPTLRLVLVFGTATALCALTGCRESDKIAKSDPAVATAAAAIAESAALEAAPTPPSTEQPPTGCKATGTKPMELGTTRGEVFGFVGDAGYLYFASWHTLGNRGDLGKLRKDGTGQRAITSLTLEARGLALDEHDIFYTEGIRLVRQPKEEGAKSMVVAPKFSSQYIALDATHVYGVPGDYGPYDRLVRVEKNGGVNFEMDVATRPEVKLGPAGYSAIVVDSNGIYVTDSGNHKLLRFGFERAKPKVLATGQAKAYALAADSDNLYFTLADKGDLMSIAKAGGAVRRLAKGLVAKSRIAADETGVVAVFAGATAGADAEIAIISREGGGRKRLASVPADQSAEAIALDKDCAYWAMRAAGSGNVTFFAVAR